MTVQHHQFCKPVQALQVCGHLHPPLWLWNMDPACWLWKKGPGFWNPVLEETSLHLLLRAKSTYLWVTKKKKTKTTTTKNFHVGPQESLLATVKRQKLAWFMHVIHHDSLLKAILRGTVEGGQRCGQQGNCWMDNIKKWTSLPMWELLTKAFYGKDWRRISAESSFMYTTRLNWSRNWNELSWIVLIFLVRGCVTQLQSTTGDKKHVVSERVWASY